MEALRPVEPRERVATIDVLRGLALFGVLAANLFVLYSFRFARHSPGPAPGALDTVAIWFLALAVHSRAQTLLTFLFGLGFAVQLTRADARGQPVWPLHLRRLAALFAIGWAHVLLLSWVDVTWGYAVVGLAMLAFVRVGDRARLAWAIALTVVPSVLYAVPSVTPALHGLLFDRPRMAYVDDFVAAARGGDRVAIAWAHATLAALWTFGGGVVWYLPWLLGRFLVGMVAGARGWLTRDGEAARAGARRVIPIAAIGTAIGVALQSVEALGVFSPRRYGIAVHAAAAVVEQLALAAQVVLYVAIVVWLMQRPAARRVLELVAPVGRMPLSTYLMQSLVCTSLFYGWGLAWDTPGPAACVGLALAIFAGQIAFAHAWLRVLRFGPAEWLWRTAVYGRPPRMR